jgi:hypothetical protein
MEQKRDSTDPSTNHEPDNLHQHNAGTFVGKQINAQKNPANAKDDIHNSNQQSSTPEAVMRVWEFIKKPEHANAIMAIFTILIFVATVAYALIALAQWSAMSGQLKEIQKQTTLTRQQLVGTQGAVITLNGEPAWDGTKQSLRVHLVNSGSVTGMITSFTATLQRRRLPEQRPIGEPFSIEISNREMPKSEGFDLEKGLPWPLPQVKDQRFWPGDEIVTMNGSYSYADGFNDTISHDFCFIWLPPWNLQVPIPNGAGWSGGQWRGGTQGCPTVQEEVNEFRGFKRHVEEVTPKQH